MFSQEQEVNDYGVLKKWFYFDYFSSRAANNWPDKQTPQDYLIRRWIFMFKELDNYPPITQNFVRVIFQKLVEYSLLKKIPENSTTGIAVIPSHQPQTVSSLHRFADFLCKGNHKLINYRDLIVKTKETQKKTKIFSETFDSLEVKASPKTDYVILIDDVSTKGVSLAAGNKVLKDSGYKGKIISLSFARTMQDSQVFESKRSNVIQLPDIFSSDLSKDTFISSRMDELIMLIRKRYRR